MANKNTEDLVGLDFLVNSGSIYSGGCGYCKETMVTSESVLMVKLELYNVSELENKYTESGIWFKETEVTKL